MTSGYSTAAKNVVTTTTAVGTKASASNPTHLPVLMRLTALVTFVLIGRENIVYKIKVLRLDGMILIKNVDAVI